MKMSRQSSRQEEGELLIPCYQLSPYPAGPQNLDDRKYDVSNLFLLEEFRVGTHSNHSTNS